MKAFDEGGEFVYRTAFFFLQIEIEQNEELEPGINLDQFNREQDSLT